MRLIIIVFLLFSIKVYSHFEPSGPSKFSYKSSLELEGLPTGIPGLPSKFSGRVFIISIGVDLCEKNVVLNYAKSDASYFLNSLKRDTGITEIREYIFRDYATEEEVRAAFDEVETIATKSDLFIFYYSGLSKGDAICLTNNEFRFSEILTYSQNIYCQRQLYIYDSCYGDKFADAFVQFVGSKPLEKIATHVDRVLIANESIGYEGRGSNNRDVTFAGGQLTGSIVNSKFPILSLFNPRKKYFWDDYKYDLRQSCSLSSRELDVLIFSEKDYINEFILNSESYLNEAYTKNKKELDEDYFNKKIQNSDRGLEEANGENKADFTIRKGETLAILVGNQNFDMLNKLPNVGNDIEQISSILENKYLTKVIKLRDVNYSTFRDTLNFIKKSYKFEEGSQLLFFGASHGVKDIHELGYLCFKDSKADNNLTTSFELQTLKRCVTSLGATNTLMIMDICHSSLAFERNNCTKPSAIEIPLKSPVFNTPFNEFSPAYKNFLNQTTNLYFGSSRDQAAADGAGSNSPFASVIISFLETNTLPVIDTYHLQKTIEAEIMHQGSISLPTFCSYNGESDGRFLFIRK